MAYFFDFGFYALDVVGGVVAFADDAGRMMRVSWLGICMDERGWNEVMLVG